MNNLDKLILDLEPQSNEWEIHRKLEKYWHLCDLRDELDFMLESNLITQEQHDKGCEHCEYILDGYENALGNDDTWHYCLRDEIYREINNY